MLGTVLSALFIGYVLYGLQMAGLVYSGPTALDALLFGTLISATDTVAVLAVFAEMKVDRLLYALVFGESILNDAVAFVMFEILLSYSGSEVFQAGDLAQALGIFVLTVVGSMVIGIGVGVLASLLTKHLQPPTRSWALVLFVTTGYLAYTLAHIAHLSGIMAVFLCGFVLRHYTVYNVTEATRTSIIDMLKAAAFMSETFIYVLMGSALVTKDLELDPAYIFVTLLVMLLGRAISIFPLSAVANLWRRTKIPFRFQVCVAPGPRGERVEAHRRP